MLSLFLAVVSKFLTVQEHDVTLFAQRINGKRMLSMHCAQEKYTNFNSQFSGRKRTERTQENINFLQEKLIDDQEYKRERMVWTL